MKKFIAKLLVMCMVVGMLPVSVFAAEYSNVSGDLGNIYTTNTDTYTLTGDTGIGSIKVAENATLTINGAGHQVYANSGDAIIATVDGSLNLNKVYLNSSDVILVDGNKPVVDNSSTATTDKGNLVTLTLMGAGNYTYVLAADTVAYNNVTDIIGKTISATGKTWTITLNGAEQDGTYTIKNDAVLTLNTSGGGSTGGGSTGGGSTGGGSTGGGGGGGGGSTTPSTSEGTTNVSADSNGNVSASTVDKAVESLTSSTATNVTMAIDAGKSGTATLPTEAMTEAMETLNDAGKNVTIALTYEQGEVALEADAMSSILEQAGSADVSVSLDTADKSAMTDAKAQAVGNAVAVELSITAGDKAITSFGGASVTVSVNFTPKAGADAATVQVWYVKDNGGKVQMTTSYASGKVSFETTHFSTYMVDYEPANVQSLSNYKDVAQNAWFYGNVQYVVYYDIMEGTTSSTFAPGVNLTRAQVAQILYNMEGKPTAPAGTFTDLADGAWYVDAVNWAASQGIVEGIGGTVFAPDRDVTRQELATMLVRYADYKGYDRETGSISAFPDASSVADWAQEGMQWAVAEGVITGASNGSTTTLNPTATATRAEAAAMMMRADVLMG